MAVTALVMEAKRVGGELLKVADFGHFLSMRFSASTVAAGSLVKTRRYDGCLHEGALEDPRNLSARLESRSARAASRKNDAFIAN